MEQRGRDSSLVSGETEPSLTECRFQGGMKMAGFWDIELVSWKRFECLLQLSQFRLAGKERGWNLVFYFRVLKISSDSARLNPIIHNVRDGALIVFARSSSPVDQFSEGISNG